MRWSERRTAVRSTFEDDFHTSTPSDARSRPPSLILVSLGLAMRRRKQPAHRSRNHTGWWIFCEVEQWTSNRQKKLSPRSRCRVYENMRLLRATSREEAYRKAMKLGRTGHPSKTHGGQWHFVGISMLLPVYEQLDDGSEILWHDRGEMSVAQVRALAKTKKQLPVFDDKKT